MAEKQDYVDCEHCVYSEECSCLWAYLSEECILKQKQYQNSKNSPGGFLGKAFQLFRKD